MQRSFIGVIGIFLFLAGLALGFSLLKGEKLAISKDSEETAFAIVADGPPLCSWDVDLPERVIAENKTQAIVIQATNPNEVDCESALSLRAPGFDLSPFKEEQKITLASKAKGSLSWILTPRKTGTFEIAVSDIINTRIFGVTVKNVFGLSSIQAKSASIIGSLFGPMLTVPWWIEKWFHQRRKKGNEKTEMN